MALQKRIRKGLNIKPKELDRALYKIKERGGSKRKQLRLIKTALFSKNNALRRCIAEDLIGLGHFRFLLKLTKKVNKKHFPPDFFREKFRFGEFPSKRGKIPEKTLQSLRQKLVNAVNKGPAFKYKGFDVYEMENLEPGGMLYHGSIYVDKNRSKKMKMVVCAHEVGEIFHHQVGIGMELLEVKRQKAEKEYLKALEMEGIERLREVSNTAENMPGMKQIARKLMEIRKRKAGSGP